MPENAPEAQETGTYAQCAWVADSRAFGDFASDLTLRQGESCVNGR